MEQLIFEQSREGRKGYSLPPLDVEVKDTGIPSNLLRETQPQLPSVSEPQVVRHFMRLSRLNFSCDTNFYPLGSCTMKHNPKINEKLQGLEGFANSHPLLSENNAQGILGLLWQLERMLCNICGMDAFTLQPGAGAQGELCGILIAKAWHKLNKTGRDTVLVPDSAHGTNPASANVAGLKTLQVKSNNRERIDMEDLKQKLNSNAALLMLTLPNTLGLFENEIKEIINLAHNAGVLVYMDGANLNALAGIIKPGDLGFDIMHVNLHKTFSTPHGGGGPGAGPVGVKKELAGFLPAPRVIKNETSGKFHLNNKYPDAIGRLHGFYGNTGVLIRAYAYITMMGSEGLKTSSETAILNANYIRAKLQKTFSAPVNEPCMHEVVFSADTLNKHNVKALDIAKKLLDYGFYAPTIYFPLIVPEAIMIEPTETETRETMDAFCQAMIEIAETAKTGADSLKAAPATTPVGRLDEVKAARELNLRYRTG